MNKLYRLIWNPMTGAWVAVAENICARGKPSRSGSAAAAAAILAGALAAPVRAQNVPPPGTLPSGGQVVAGQAGIQQSGTTLTVTQGSARAAIDWRTFNVGSQAQVNFVQPSAQSVTLNRVQDANPSQIFGRITANGQVYLSNPNGVYFAPGASVDVGGLVATTHRIGLDDFMAGRVKFERQGATGRVVNEGELKAALGGYIALLAPEVRNQGVIVAHMGTVALAAGEAFELQFDANNTLASLRVEPSTIRSLVDNRSAVLAPGGLVILSAQAMDRVHGGVIRNSGRIEATGLQQRGGRIVLEASDRIENSGALAANASAEGPAGTVSLKAPEVLNTGTVEARGTAPTPEAVAAAALVAIGGSVQVDAGHFTQGSSGVLDTSAALQGGMVQIQASGAVALQGRIQAQATADAPAIGAAPTQGGTVQVQAAQITLDGARVDTSGARGGHVQLDASAPAPGLPTAPLPAPEPGKVALIGSTVVSSRGRHGPGGEITMLGDDLLLGDHTALDASGTHGGGRVRVGGGWQGGEGLYQATRVDMGADARIDVSATERGHGGSAVLWSDLHRDNGTTTARGTILARGGAQGGDGGKVETSGHEIGIDGVQVNAGTTSGKAGLWLIDPYDYTIGTTQAATISSALNSSDVTVTTTASNASHGATGAGTGHITFSSGVGIAKTAAGTTTLTLQAHGRIIGSNYSISSSGGPLNTVLWAGLDGNGWGAQTGTITTLGGHVWVGGGSGSTTWNGLTVGDGPALGKSTANQNALDLTGAINTSHGASGGDVYLWGAKGTGAGTGIAWHTSPSIVAGNGNVTLRSGDFWWNAPLDVTTTGAFKLWSHAGTLTTDTGSFTQPTDLSYFKFNATPSAVTWGGPSNAQSVTLSPTYNPTLTVAGPIIVYGGLVTVNNNLSTTGANAPIQLLGRTGVRFGAGVTLQTAAAGSAVVVSGDTDVNGSGNVVAQGALTITTQGSNITLGGGADGTGFASGTASSGNDEAPGVWVKGTTTLDSNGGDIAIRGQSFNGSYATGSFRPSWGVGLGMGGTRFDAATAAAVSLNSGTGTITIEGTARNPDSASNGSSYGILFNSWEGSSAQALNITSANTTANAIRLIGDTQQTQLGQRTKWGLAFWSTANSIRATGAGGGITLTARTFDGNDHGQINWYGGEILATSGPITLQNVNQRLTLAGDMHLGSRAGVTGHTTSSSDIAISAERLDISAGQIRFGTTGAVTIEPYGASFMDYGATPNVLSSLSLTGIAFNQNSQTMNGLRLGKVGNLADITVNQSATAAGAITILGGSINLNANLTSTAPGSAILVKATDNITSDNSRTLQTNQGHITLWSDSDASGAGHIRLGDGNSLNTANGSTASGLSGGGHIVLAGGLDNGAHGGTASDGLPDGVAASTTGNAVRLGITTANATLMHSGGGDIVIRGTSTANSGSNNDNIGTHQLGAFTADAGTGAIVITGTSTNFYGLNFGFPTNGDDGIKRLSLVSAKASGTAVALNGVSSASHGNVFNYNNPKEILATGGGGITIDGTGAGAAYGVFLQNQDVLATSGAVQINGGTKGIYVANLGARLGAKAGSAITASNSDITLTADAVTLAASTAANTSGTLTVQPSSASFASALTWPLSGLSMPTTLGGLTLGKAGNLADITVGTGQSVYGPIVIHGGTVTLNAGLTTSNTSTGDVSITAATGLAGAGNIALADGRTLTVTQAGNSTYNGVISGTGASFVKNGTGDLGLGGTSTYGGSTTVNGGVLSLAAANVLPDSTALTVNASGTFSLNGFNETVGSIAGSGLIVNGAVVRDGLVMWLDAGNTASYNGTGTTWYDLSGNGYHGTLVGGPIYNASTSLFTFDSNTKYVQLASLPANFLGNTVTGLTVFTVANFGTAQMWERVVDLGNVPSPINTPSNNIILSRNGLSDQLAWEFYNGVGAGAAYTSIGNNAAVGNSVKGSYAGTADGANLRVFRDGTLNTTTASVALPAAIARDSNYIGKSNWAQDDTFRGDIGTLMVYNHALSQAEITKNHQLLFNRATATLTAGGNNTSTTFSGKLENGVGTLNLVKAGTGTLTLSGANSYAGTTTVQAGTLRNGAADVVPRWSAVTVGAAGTWDLNGFANTVGSVTGAGSITLGSGTLSTGGLNSNTTFSGTITGSGNVTKSGSGIWALTGANSWSGTTTISAGTLAGAASDTLPDATAVTVDSGATLKLSGTTETIGSLAGAGAVDLGTSALTTGGNNSSTTFSGTASGGGSLVKAGSGSFTLTGNNSYTGTTHVAAGTLQVGGGGTSGTLGTGAVSTQGTLAINRSGNIGLSAAAANASGISGSGHVTATSGGSLTIDRAVAVSGNVGLTATAGNLAIDSAVSAGTVTLNASGTVTDGGSGSITATGLALMGGAVTLDAATSNVGTLAASGVAGLSYRNNGALTIGTVGATTGIAASGAIDIATSSGNLTVSANVSTSATGSAALVLNAGRNAAAGTASGGDLVVSGSPSLTTGAGGRATLFTGSVAGSTGLAGLVGSGSGRFRYHSDEATTNYTLVLGSGVQAIFREQPALSIAVDSQTMTYGDARPADSLSFGGLVNGDTAAQALAVQPTVTSSIGTSGAGFLVAGAHVLSASGAVGQLGYAVGTPSGGTLTVDQRTLTVNLSGVDKTYDGSAAASVTSSNNRLSGDVLSVTIGSASFADAHAAVGKSIAVTGLALGGADGGNYVLASTSGNTTATIARRSVTVSGFTAADKVYDGSATAAINSLGSVSTGVGSETLGLSGATASFADANAGTGKTVTATGYLLGDGSNGGLASNYQLTTTSATTTASIARKAVTVSGLAAADKVYDGSTAATFSSPGAVSTGVGSETLSLSGATAAFADANAGTGKVVTTTGYVLGDGSHGGLATNYELTSSSAITTANISRKAVTVSGLSATDKVYDGSTTATIASVGSVSTGVGSETLVLSASGASFADANAGTGKTVTATGFVLGDGSHGGLASNYQLTGTSATTTASIARKPVTVSGFAAADKVYDGGTAATISSLGAVSTGVGSETLSLSSATASFADANAGTGKTVTATGYVLGDGSHGGLASNYQLTTASATTTASIARKAVTVSGLAATDKVYDGSTAATISSLGSVSTGVGSETLSLSGATATFVDANAGTGKVVTATGYVLGNGSNGGLATNYALTSSSASTTASITRKAVTVSGFAATDKVYDGRTTATIASIGSVSTGVGSETLTLSASGSSFADANAGTGKTVTATGYALGDGSHGGLASNYQLNGTSATTTANIERKLVTVSGLSAADKLYDGNTSATITQAGIVSTGVGSETLTLQFGDAHFADANAGDAKTVTATGYVLADGTNGGRASNYRLASSSATTSATIERAPLTVTADADAKFVTQPDAAGFAGVSLSGFVNGETAAVLAGSASVGRSNAGTELAGHYVGVLVPELSGLSAQNYRFETRNGDFSIVPSGQLLVRVQDQSGTYGSAAGYTLASAAYFDGSRVVTLPTLTALGDNRFTVADGAGASATFTVQPTAGVLSTGGHLRPGAYALGAAEVATVNAANFSNSLTLVGAHTVTPRAVTASTTGGVTKVYDGSTAMNGVSLGLDGLASGDLVSVGGTGNFASANAGTALAYTVRNVALGGTDAPGYYLSGGSSFSASNGTITPKTVTLTASKVYDGSTALSGSQLSIGGLVGIETLAHAGATASDAHVATAGKSIAAVTLLDGSNGGLARNYRLPLLDASTAPVTITPAPLSVALDNTGVSKTYDGSTAAPAAFVPRWAFTGLVAGDSAAGIGHAPATYDSKDVATARTLTVDGLSLDGIVGANGSLPTDYRLLTTSSAVAASITPRTVSVSGLAVAGKTYDGSTAASIVDAGRVSTGVGSETLAIGGTPGARFADAQAGTGKTVVASGYALRDGSSGGLAANYRLDSDTASAVADIAPATLTVVANPDAKFVTQSDAAGFAGVSLTGFVNGETAAVIGGSARVTRSNAGVDAAGTYRGVLVPDASGLVSGNYRFVTRSGDFSIVPSGQLLVRVDPASSVYGDAATYTLRSASYFDGQRVIELPAVAAEGGNRFTVADGVGGSASFRLVPVAPALSGAGQLKAGAYALDAADIATRDAQNFSNRLTVVGSQLVTTRSLAASAEDGVSKVYDGTTAMNGLALRLQGQLAGDALSVSGNGAFDSRAAGQGLGYTVSDLMLGSADAANYHLLAGPRLSGSDGSITPRPLTLDISASDKVYDGSTGAALGVRDNRLAGDQLGVQATGRFADKNVGSGKTVFIDGLALTGADAANYRLVALGETLASITRLGSVRWVGGSSGDWFDPRNWDGGAVPDRANVSQVLIPAGVTVSFGSGTAQPPAEDGPVTIDSLGNAGTLSQSGGRLDVGSGGITLDGLRQSGGSLSSAGNIRLGRLEQTGGTLSTTADLEVAPGPFSQASSGDIHVGGSARIVASNGVTLGRLTVGRDLDVTSTGGPITQAAGTALAVAGRTALDAGSFDVLLDAEGNQLVGPVSARGRNVQLTNAAPTGLRLGLIDASGNLTVRALVGDVQQAPDSRITVGGDSRFDAETGTVLLLDSGNRFAGPLRVQGQLPLTDSARVLAPTSAPAPLPQPDQAPPALNTTVAAPGSVTRSTTPSAGLASDIAPRGSGQLVVKLVSPPAEQTPGAIAVTVPSDMAQVGFRFLLPAALTQGQPAGVTAHATLVDGAPLPAWLRFDAAERSFMARQVPAGALPLQVVIDIGGRRSVMTVTAEGTAAP